LAKVDGHSCHGGVLARDLDKRAANLESGNRIRTELRKLGRENSPAGKPPRELCEIVEPLGCIGRVLLGDHAFHANLLASLGRRQRQIPMKASRGPQVRRR
jgi:hypothetical protein